MKKILTLLFFAMMSTIGVMAQNNTVQLPYTANFSQHWTANGATVVDSNHVEFTFNGQEIVGPWMDLEAGMLGYNFTIRLISGTLEGMTMWAKLETDYGSMLDYSGVWIDDSVFSMDGGIPVPTCRARLKISLEAPDTMQVVIRVSDLDIFQSPVTLSIEGPSSAQPEDTLVFIAHATTQDGFAAGSLYWDLYDEYGNWIPDGSVVSIIEYDSVIKVVFHTEGTYNLVARVYTDNVYNGHTIQTYTSKSVYITTPVDCDSLTLPYKADFTQCWLAIGGATIIDPAHAAITSSGQKIASPWIESLPGKTFIHWSQQRDPGNFDYDHEQYTVTIQGENGIIESWVYEASDWSPQIFFNSPGGRIRVMFEYTGSRRVPSFQISDVAIYNYEIDVSLEGLGAAQVGDTITFIAHAILQNGDILDDYRLSMYDSDGNWISDNSTVCTIVSRHDSVTTVVLNAPGRYYVNCYVYKYEVFRNYYAFAYDNMYIAIVDRPVYTEDSLYYTSAAKDTVIGSHPQLHTANLPESVVTVTDSAFFSHSHLVAVNMPDGLTHIGKMSFALVDGLTEVTIPRGVTFIDDNAFWSDENLTVVNFNADSCMTMSPTTASNGTTWPVFIGCNNLHTVNIGANVTRIPDRAFNCCIGLRDTLVIPDAVTYIGYDAFRHYDENYTDPLYIVIGSSVQEIGNHAFYCHSHLASVESRNPVPPTIYDATFLVWGHVTLTVPCGTKAAYAADPLWNEFETYGSGIIDECEGIEDIENVESAVEVSGRTITVANPGAEAIRLYDIAGRQLATSRKSTFVFRFPTQGVYVVKIGNQPARKVVAL